MSLIFSRAGDVICVEPFKTPWIVRYADVDGNVTCQRFNARTCKGEGDFVEFRVSQVVHKYLKLTADAAAVESLDRKQQAINEMKANLFAKYGKFFKEKG